MKDPFAPPAPEELAGRTDATSFLDRAAAAPTLKTFTAAELQELEFPPIHWIVPDLLTEGLTLLCGKPKLGKSWLGLDIALAVACGGETLGREVERGDVLNLALEDNLRRLQRRLDRIAYAMDWPAGLTLATEAPRVGAGLEKAIRDWAAGAASPRLVIVDTLATVRPVGRIPDNAHTADYAALRGLHGVANELGLAVIVVHHLRKSDADDPFDAVSGSTGLTGCADSTLILTQSSEGVTLYGRGRDLEEVETALEFDATSCRWRDLGDPAEAFASDTRQGVFAAIRAGKHSPSDIRDFTGLDHELVKKTLQRMARAGDLRKSAKGQYEIPTDPLSPPSPCPRPSSPNGDAGTGGTGVWGAAP